MAANRDSAAVARAFLTAYLSWAWNDQPTPAAAVRARTRQWDTDLFDAQLAGSSGATSSTNQRIAAHEVDTVAVASADPVDASSTAVTYVALVQVTTSKDGSPPTPRASYINAHLVLLGPNWYVNAVTL